MEFVARESTRLGRRPARAQAAGTASSPHAIGHTPRRTRKPGVDSVLTMDIANPDSGAISIFVRFIYAATTNTGYGYGLRSTELRVMAMTANGLLYSFGRLLASIFSVLY